MNLVNHGLEMNRFGRKLIRRPLGFVVGIRVVTEHTILNVLPEGTVQCQSTVAGVTSFLGDYKSSRHWCFVRDCKGKRLVEPNIPNRCLIRRSGLNRDVTISFNANGEAALGIGGDCLLEGIVDNAT